MVGRQGRGMEGCRSHYRVLNNLNNKSLFHKLEQGNEGKRGSEGEERVTGDRISG